MHYERVFAFVSRLHFDGAIRNSVPLSNRRLPTACTDNCFVPSGKTIQVTVRNTTLSYANSQTYCFYRNLWRLLEANGRKKGGVTAVSCVTVSWPHGNRKRKLRKHTWIPNMTQVTRADDLNRGNNKKIRKYVYLLRTRFHTICVCP